MQKKFCLKQKRRTEKSLEKIALNEKYGKDLMKRVHRLETGNEYRLFAELQKQLAEATDHRNVFDSKLTFLEKKVEAILNYKINGETSTNITAIMTYLKNQSKRTDALLSEVEQQQEQTDFQDTLIQKLLKKVESLSKRTKHSKFSIATKKMRDSSKEQS
ncbi:uncharacterized protein LOC128343605 isoform X2 [Hemicordylus capensis]|uniref:uncharacterized protein LOC128343605 isoform X2 n=1 Tax=Hemicordylus capensis TaxID=884348 RepID=UPI002303F271|nr:uncharacterized protein LOC128343605 isoform X2 [Hemicordylus capensis]